MPRLYTYLRTGTEGDADQHEQALLTWLAKYPGHERIGAFTDCGISGLTPPEHRPGLRALLAAQEQSPADFVLVPQPHHLSRDRNLSLHIRRTLSRLGARVLTTDSLPTDGIEEESVYRGVLEVIAGHSRGQRRTGRTAHATP